MKYTIKKVLETELGEYLSPSSIENIKKIKQIYYVGDFKKENDIKIAIVGSRNMSAYGKKVAYELSGKLATAGVTIVSGLMYGIDMTAHQGALDVGGRTIAVLGYGFNFLESQKYAKNIVDKILLSKDSTIISQFNHNDPPAKWTFPNRNLLITLLCKYVIVVEAGHNSGTLITAEYALEEGRDIYAVPGSIYSDNSAGTNQLIKIGATPIISVSDLLAELNLKNNAEMRMQTVTQNFSTLQKQVFDLLKEYSQKQGAYNLGIDIDELYEFIINSLDISMDDFVLAVLDLEIFGVIKKDISGKLVLV